MGMKRVLVVLCVFASLLVAPAPARAELPHKVAPPGQLYVVNVNAQQREVLDVRNFRMLLDLTEAVLTRPPAFDGGSDRIGAAPDVIVLEEMTASNLEIFEKLLRQRSEVRYGIVGSTSVLPKFVVNLDRVAIQGEATEWADVCYAPLGTSSDSEEEGAPRIRPYQWANFTQLDTGAPFAVAGVHFSKKYGADTGEQMCLERNIDELRRQLSATTAPTIIAGDFNKRAVESPYDCDMEQQSAPLQWWLKLTAPSEGTVYQDAVTSYHRERGLSLEHEWTHEQKLQSLACDQSTRVRRGRIDYMFTSGMEIASAHADHPGWAGAEPGTRHPTNPRYSDHRFIAARLKLVGPSRPAPPVVVPQQGGSLELSWTAPETPVAGWLLYRGTGARPYTLLARLAPEVLTYTDFATQHGRRYRYALAAVDETGAQGLESEPATAVAHARGPRITSRSPGRNAVRVERRADVVARFDEVVDPDSVRSRTIDLFRDGRRICGRTTQEGPRLLVFDPCRALGKAKEYRVAVYAVSDRLGNRGLYEDWRFTTR